MPQPGKPGLYPLKGQGHGKGRNMITMRHCWGQKGFFALICGNTGPLEVLGSLKTPLQCSPHLQTAVNSPVLSIVKNGPFQFLSRNPLLLPAAVQSWQSRHCFCRSPSSTYSSSQTAPERLRTTKVDCFSAGQQLQLGNSFSCLPVVSPLWFLQIHCVYEEVHVRRVTQVSLHLRDSPSDT